jgi:hypothetical protein
MDRSPLSIPHIPHRQAPGLRKDKAFKIFVNPLAEKQRRVMEAKGKRIDLDLHDSGDMEVCAYRRACIACIAVYKFLSNAIFNSPDVVV